MASTPSTENPNPSDTNAESNPRKIVLHVLCPTLASPNRFTFHDFTLSSTVASLKTRLSESIPSQPTPAIQKLIYCGKPISNDGLTLQSVLEPVEVNILVQCDSAFTNSRCSLPNILYISFSLRPQQNLLLLHPLPAPLQLLTPDTCPCSKVPSSSLAGLLHLMSPKLSKTRGWVQLA